MGLINSIYLLEMTIMWVSAPPPSPQNQIWKLERESRSLAREGGGAREGFM